MLQTCCTAVRLVDDLLSILLHNLLYNESTTNRTCEVRPIRR